MKIVYERLTKNEANKLNKFLREEHGNVNMASGVTGLNVLTIKRATGGLRLKAENAQTIRTKLLA